MLEKIIYKLNKDGNMVKKTLQNLELAIYTRTNEYVNCNKIHIFILQDALLLTFDVTYK